MGNIKTCEVHVLIKEIKLNKELTEEEKENLKKLIKEAKKT